MTTKYYEWGIRKGGSNTNGPVIPAEASYGPPDPFTGTVALGGTTITFVTATKQVTVRNTHDTAPLEYSYDGGVTWLLLGPYGSTTEEVSIADLDLRRVAAAAVTYEVIAVLTSA